MTAERDRTKLILHAIDGGHLRDFLPGANLKNAVLSAFFCDRPWFDGGLGPGGIAGQITRHGVGEWPIEILPRLRTPGNALLYLTWDDILATIARGCSDGYRERYEQALADWCAALDRHKPPPPIPDMTPLDDATEALIRHGVEQSTVQPALF